MWGLNRGMQLVTSILRHDTESCEHITFSFIKIQMIKRRLYKSLNTEIFFHNSANVNCYGGFTKTNQELCYVSPFLTTLIKSDNR